MSVEVVAVFGEGTEHSEHSVVAFGEGFYGKLFLSLIVGKTQVVYRLCKAFLDLVEVVDSLVYFGDSVVELSTGESVIL